MNVQYRRLTRDELHELEKEFVDFLVINGITADEWVKMKSDAPEKADRMIDLFSDVVFEGIFRKVKYLEFISDNEVMTFQCLEKKIVLVGLECTDEKYNLSDPNTVRSFSRKIPDHVKVFQTDKEYKKKREVELYEMTQRGCTIGDGKLFKDLSLLYSASV